MTTTTKTNPTADLWSTYQEMFLHFNEALWGGKLPIPVLNLSRYSGAYGFFAAGLWRDSLAPGEHGPVRLTHEISLNPDHSGRAPREVASTLVHEMVHLWQQENGTPGKGAYHNQEWAAEMKRIGLQPVSFDQPGKEVGRRVSHRIVDGGAFDLAFRALPAKAMPWATGPQRAESDVPAPPPRSGKNPGPRGGTSKRSKTAYECNCGQKVWGKPGLSISCDDCGSPFEERS